jgi:hypothetical protein
VSFIKGKVVYNLPIGNVLILSNGNYLKRLVFLSYENVNFHFIESKCEVLEKAEKFWKSRKITEQVTGSRVLIKVAIKENYAEKD